jgi:hypothetical protein
MLHSDVQAVAVYRKCSASVRSPTASAALTWQSDRAFHRPIKLLTLAGRLRRTKERMDTAHGDASVQADHVAASAAPQAKQIANASERAMNGRFTDAQAPLADTPVSPGMRNASELATHAQPLDAAPIVDRAADAATSDALDQRLEAAVAAVQHAAANGAALRVAEAQHKVNSTAGQRAPVASGAAHNHTGEPADMYVQKQAQEQQQQQQLYVEQQQHHGHQQNKEQLTHQDYLQQQQQQGYQEQQQQPAPHVSQAAQHAPPHVPHVPPMTAEQQQQLREATQADFERMRSNLISMSNGGNNCAADGTGPQRTHDAAAALLALHDIMGRSGLVKRAGGELSDSDAATVAALGLLPPPAKAPRHALPPESPAPAPASTSHRRKPSHGKAPAAPRAAASPGVASKAISKPGGGSVKVSGAVQYRGVRQRPWGKCASHSLLSAP